MDLRINIIAVLTTLAISSASTVVNLTKDNWDSETKGKAVWIKFCTEACSHCQKMHIAWERLGDYMQGKDSVLIGKVNCDKETELCEAYNVLGTPTLLWGSNIYDLRDYGGEKTFLEMKEWSDEVLIPSCSPDNFQPCTDKEKQNIKEWMALSVEAIQEMIDNVAQKEKEIKLQNKEGMDVLQKKYDEMNQEHTTHKAQILAEIKFLKRIRLALAEKNV